MNREERHRTIVGGIVLFFLIAAALVIFFARVSGENYVVVGEFPSVGDLKGGSAVEINGVRVGAVRKITQESPATTYAVRMDITGKAFRMLGRDSVAWVTPGASSTIIIQPGNPDGKGRFLKIRPVRGIEPPSR